MMKRLLQKLRGRCRGRRGFTLVELMVVIGIVALLISISASAFMGGTRQDSVTKSRDQLRDVLMLARQQACITGRTHVVVCWNARSEIKSGNRTETIDQGRYAMFEYIGDLWARGNGLYVPFKVQLDAMQSLKVGTRLVSLLDPDATTFPRIDKVTQDRTKSEQDREQLLQQGLSSMSYKYLSGGGYQGADWSPIMYKVAEYSGNLATDKETEKVPLAVRVSTTYHLPEYYAFNSRSVFIFTPDGCMGNGSATSISAKPPTQAANSREATFSVSVNNNGEVKVGD